MYPIALDVTRIPILLIGSGELMERRRAYLEEAGAQQLVVRDSASAEDIANATIVMVAGLPRAQAETIVTACRNAHTLVNVEDINELCDFYFTANVKRGDLIIAVSTSGASPTLARKIRDRIASLFGEEWATRLREMAELRKAWKDKGADMKQVMENTQRHLDEKGWLAEGDRAA